MVEQFPSDETPGQVASTARLRSSRDCGENADNGVNSACVHVFYEDARLGNTGVDEGVGDAKGAEEGYPCVDMREFMGVREGKIDGVAE